MLSTPRCPKDKSACSAGDSAHEQDPDRTLQAQRCSTAQSLVHINDICATTTNLFTALLLIASAHAHVAADVLAVLIKEFRSDVADLQCDDVSALITAIRTDGEPGFDVALRERRRVAGRPNALPRVGRRSRTGRKLHVGRPRQRRLPA